MVTGIPVRFRPGALLWAVLLAGLAGWPGENLHAEAPPVERRWAEPGRFFESPHLSTFEVELNPSARAELTRSPRRYVPGRIVIDGRGYEVGVRLQGTGNFEPVSRRPNLTIKFNWVDRDQEFAGVTKLFLKNARQDPTFLCEFTASAVFADAGLPAPRVTHGRLRLNGRDLGLCVVAEAVNKRFLRRYFKDEHGALYEGAFRDVQSHLDQDNGPPADRSDLAALTAAARLPDPQERRERLAKVLDVDAFLDFLAVEMIVANWDGYALHQNNYRIYHDPDSDRMFFIPHGLDNTFFESGLPLMPLRKSLLAAVLLETAEDREAFRQRVAALVAKVLDLPKVRQRVQCALAKMVQGATAEEAQWMERRAALFQQRVEERLCHLGAELAGVRPGTPEFDKRGIAPLSGWAAKPDWNYSPLQQMRRDGRDILAIQATNGFCFGSWRLPVWLQPGKYRLEGLAAAESADGLPSMTGSGAGVRVLGRMRGGGLEGSSHWMPVAHEFSVQEGGERVELIAELRAFTGRAMFDARKFRLVRIDE